MATRYICRAYKRFRIPRDDAERTYICFEDHVFDAYTDSDRAKLAQFPELVELVGALNGVPSDAAGPRLDPAILSWYSPLLGVSDGYGNSAEKMLLALEAAQQGVSVESGWQLTGETLIAKILDRAVRHGSVRLAYCPPTEGQWRRRYPGQAVIGFSMWEDDRIPPIWEAAIRQVDVVATCSRFCERIFTEFMAERGIDIPVVYAPLGVKEDLVPYRRRNWRKGSEPFVFLHSASAMTEKRKGAAVALAAFQQAFPGRDDVRMIFRARFGGLDAGGDKRISFRLGNITEAQKNEVFDDVHAYVYPSYGEGFGLMPLEAIASGLPTICAASSGMLDYAKAYYGVGCDPEPSGNSVPWQPVSPGQWARPRVDELAERMRWIVDHYEQATAFAARAAKYVRTDWSYERGARALIAAKELARERADAALAAAA